MGLMTADTALQTGLYGAASGIANKVDSPYPTYVANAPMASITSPNYQYTAGDKPTYQGLMGGDYDALQKALAQPGQIAAQNAYQTGYNNLNNVMGGRGLYGSTIMGNQMNQGLGREYMNALSVNDANAAAQRYQLQQAGLQNQNAFNQNLYGLGLSQQEALNKFNQTNAQLGMTQAANLWNSGNTEATRKQTYLQGLADYYNNLQNTKIAQNLALAGGGSPYAQTALNTSTQTGLANQTASSNDLAGWLGLAGTIGGGLLSYDWGSLFG
jgi:hypothetical protein